MLGSAPPVFGYIASFAVLDNTGQGQTDTLDPLREPVEREDESPEVEILAQIQPDSMMTLSLWAAGRGLEQEIFLIAFRRDLARRNLLDADTGFPVTPKNGDRLTTVKNSKGSMVITIRETPGAYVDAVIPASFGPGGFNALFEIRLNARGVRR